MKTNLPDKYKVPTDYFDSLEDNILNELEINSTAKVIPLYKKPWLKIALSICATLLLFVGIYWNLNTSHVTESDRQLAKEVIIETYFESDDELDEFKLIEEDSVYDDIFLIADN